jgi:hypothetical protein
MDWWIWWFCKTMFCFQEEDEKVKVTPEDIHAEKMRRLRLQEESDLELAKETFGMLKLIIS